MTSQVDGDMMLQVSEDEVWVPGEFPKAQARGLTRLTRNGDDWVVTGLVLVADEIHSQTLKGIPLGAITMVMRQDKDFAADVLTRQAQSSRALNDLIDKALAAGGASDPDWQPPPRNKLRRPDGTDPDGHARAVAAAYEEAVRLGKAPGPAIAAEAGVPVATARGWVQEARRRGHLAKGRKGRAG